MEHVWRSLWGSTTLKSRTAATAVLQEPFPWLPCAHRPCPCAHQPAQPRTSLRFIPTHKVVRKQVHQDVVVEWGQDKSK
eukprot:4353322-Amphidinium_carterae.1